MAENIQKNSKAENMASSLALKASKKELRTSMKQKLSNLTTESINGQSATVFKNVTNFKPYNEAKRIGIYLSMPTAEIQTDAIVRHALRSGKQVFVPYLHKSPNPSPETPKSVMDMVDLRSLSDYDSLNRDNWGIPTIEADTVHEREHILEEPTEESRALDMILMPGVAFDVDPKSGYLRRLGHGKGFYDYFLHRYMQSRASEGTRSTNSPGTTVLLYGLALKEQFLQAKTDGTVPVGAHDNLLHGLFVGDGETVDGLVAVNRI